MGRGGRPRHRWRSRGCGNVAATDNCGGTLEQGGRFSFCKACGCMCVCVCVFVFLCGSSFCWSTQKPTFRKFPLHFNLGLTRLRAVRRMLAGTCWPNWLHVRQGVVELLSGSTNALAESILRLELGKQVVSHPHFRRTLIRLNHFAITPAMLIWED